MFVFAEVGPSLEPELHERKTKIKSVLRLFSLSGVADAQTLQ